MFEINSPLQQASRRSQERGADATVSTARSRADALSHQLLSKLGANFAGLDAARRTEALIR